MKQSREKVVEAANGWFMLLIGLAVVLGAIVATIFLVKNNNPLGLLTILCGVCGASLLWRDSLRCSRTRPAC